MVTVGEMIEPVDARIVSRVMELTKNGVRRVGTMRKLVHEFVKNELFHGENIPPWSRRRFFPTNKDLINIMAKAKKGFSDKDQENLMVLVTKWKEENKEDKFFYRPCQAETDSSEKVDFLFAYQSSWQQRLLNL
ncbi:uncharacterized protein LOC106168636 [Lingula anatina]|uniref:Uncharacterized protein LOC106168636 n=1 Tax=Lingula anatina TaxID=7574 RepID=A0A1S3IYF5_LINAN|nr:uncharacterized protein LOC106168636 [Lingula anatina]|eukprot:XP_013403235.1 uncharacterized protein LOC106168636 [Lingula anatina]